MSGFFGYVGSHPGLLLFTAISVVLVVYLLYAMLNPAKF